MDPEEGEGEGFVHRPNMLDDDERNGLMCFMEGSRQCGADCMAFLGFGNEVAVPGLSVQQSQCSLLVNVERIGKHSVIIASLLSKKIKDEKNAEIDRKREAQFQPGPMGVPAPGQRGGA